MKKKGRKKGEEEKGKNKETELVKDGNRRQTKKEERRKVAEGK